MPIRLSAHVYYVIFAGYLSLIYNIAPIIPGYQSFVASITFILPMVNHDNDTSAAGTHHLYVSLYIDDSVALSHWTRLQ